MNKQLHPLVAISFQYLGVDNRSHNRKIRIPQGPSKQLSDRLSCMF